MDPYCKINPVLPKLQLLILQTRSVDPAAPTPDFPAAIKPLLERVCSLPGVGSLDQLTVNEYPPGVGLSPHIDTHSAFGDAIVSLSLAGPAAMVFRKRGTGEQRSVLLPERSLLIMTDAARFEWEHYIPHRKSDPLVDGDVVPRTTRRVSLTFRLVRQGPCQCQYPEHCDSQKGEIPPTRMAQTGRGAPRAAGTQLTASAGASTRAPESGDSLSGTAHQQLEDENVRDVYDAIAGHFSATRFAIWPRVREFIESLPPGALVADVGCGNGKYFGARRDIFVAGSDRSKGNEIPCTAMCPRLLNSRLHVSHERLKLQCGARPALHVDYLSVSSIPSLQD